jgi:hypothetical protein
MIRPIVIALCCLLLAASARAQADLAPGWNPITPGGAAVCSDGTPYTFYARPGDPSRLLFYFQGGGACWDDGTCAPGSGWFDPIVQGGEADNYSHGVFDPANPENPLAGYSAVMVTYCTGDYHTGNRRVEYAWGAVEHRGAVNAGAAIAWAARQFPRPAQVVVVGCSAGAIGSIYHAQAIARRYPSARLRQIGDAAVGVIPPGWGGFDRWGARRAAAPDQFVTALYRAAAGALPNARFAQYTTSEDNVQIGYYVQMGAVNAWTLEMRARLDGLARLGNFRAYIAPGGEHCILETPRFYSEVADGVRFRDWFAALIDGALPARVGS